MNVDTVSVEQHGDDYIRPNAELEMRPQIRSNQQLKCMYSECFDNIGGINDYEYHIDLDPKFKARVQTPHKVA